MLTDWEVQFMTLFRRLSEPQKKAIALTAVLTACANESQKSGQQRLEQVRK